METKIIILSENASANVRYAEFLSTIKKNDSISFNALYQGKRGLGEFLIKIFNSVGLTTLVNEIRNFFSNNYIELTYTDPSGKKVELKAKGKDVNATTIVGYISGNLNKESIEQIDIKKIEYPLELKLGIKKDSE